MKPLLDWASRPRPRALLVLALAYGLIVGSDQDGETFSSDTARYALVGRELVERGDWTRLTVDGKLYAKKPPLVFWLEAAAFSILGFTEAAARLPSRAFGLATVGLLMALVGRRHGRRTAFWAGCCLATWHAFQRSAANCRLDSTLTFFTLAAIGAFLAMDRRGFSERRSLFIGALLGLAVLAKGPAGLLAAAAIALGATVAGRSRLLARAAPLALLALLAVCAPWYALQLAQEGQAWWSELENDLLRSKDASLGVILTLYGREFFLAALPWLPAAAAGVAAACGRLARRPRRALPEAILLGLLAVLAVGIATRGAHHARYLIPAVPALAWLGAAWAVPRCRARWIHRAAAGALAVTVLVGFPLAHAAGLFPMREKYPDIRQAAAFVQAAAPAARTLPTWPSEIGAGVSAATRFYFGLSLQPFDPGDASQPPLVLMRDRERRAEFEALYRLPLLFEGKEHLVYRTR